MTTTPLANLPISIVLEFTRVDDPQDPHAFRFEPQSYTLRTPGGGRRRLDIEWSRELLADIEAIRRPGRDPAIVQRVGEVMRRALDAIGWDGLGEQLRAASEGGRGAIVTLRSNAAELYALPWELVAVGPSGQHLGELPGVLLRHEWPATLSIAESPSPRPEGGRMLLAWSAAGGQVPAADHLRAIIDAYAAGYVAFDPKRDVLANATAGGIAEALGKADAEGVPFAVLHLLCHGGRAGSTFGMVLDGPDGMASIVDAGRLRLLLAPHARTLRLIVLAACDGGNTGDPGNYLGSVAQSLHRAGFQSVLASRYPLSVTGSTTLTKTLYRALLVELRPLEYAFTAARAQLARHEAYLDWASLQLYAREADGDDTRPVIFRPYRGLLSFEAQHRRFFFGRDAERSETITDLQALIDGGKPRFIIVAGASGTGKSSMVLSGVIPDVEQLKARRSGRWEVSTLVPGDKPLQALETALKARTDDTRPLLLVVDQFEELFTHTTDAGARAAFVRQLWSLAKADTGVHCIVTIRIDFLARCGELVLDEAGVRLDKIAFDGTYRVFVAYMAPEQVRAAIEGPAARVGLDLAPGLTDRILADVGEEPGALPLLQHALDQLWRRRVGRTLGAEVYAEIGGLIGALQQEADSLIKGLDPEQRRLARRLLTRLVGIRDDAGLDTRRRVDLTQLDHHEASGRTALDSVLEKLVHDRLVVRNEAENVPTLEIAHEALIRKWPQLRTWITEDRAMLTELGKLKEWVQQWEQHQTLLTGAQLGYASDLVRRYPDDIDRGMGELVRTSEARRRRQRRIVGAVLVTLASGVVGLAGISLYAFQQRALAEQQTARANELLDTAKGITRELLFEVLPKFEDLPGTADLQRDIHERLKTMQRTLRSDTTDDAEVVHLEIQQKIKRGALAMTHERLGQARSEFDDARVLAERLVRDSPENPNAQRDLSLSIQKLGDVEVQAGNLAAARAYYDRSLQVREELARTAPTNSKAQRGLSIALDRLGDVELQAGNLDAARSVYDRSLKVSEALAAADPTSATAQSDLSISLSMLGDVEVQAGNLDAARNLYDRSLKMTEALAAADPTSVTAQQLRSAALNKSGDVEVQVGNLDAARSAFTRSLEVSEASAAADPTSAMAQRDLYIALAKLGDVEEQAGHIPAARGLYDRAVKMSEALATTDPTNALVQRDLFVCREKLGYLEVQAGNLAVARGLFDDSLKVSEALAAVNPTSAVARRDLSVSMQRLGDVELEMGNLAPARSLFARSLKVSEDLAAADSTSAMAQRDLSGSVQRLGFVELKAGNLATARGLIDRSIRLSEALAAESPNSGLVQMDLAISLNVLGDVELQAGNFALAHQHLERALSILDMKAKETPADADILLALVDNYKNLIKLAKREGVIDAQKYYAESAHVILKSMGARGQVRGRAAYEKALIHVQQVLAQLILRAPSHKREPSNP